MNRPPRFRPTSARDIAEAAFKPKQPAAAAPIPKPAAAVPGAKEQVSLRIDQDVLQKFQEEGPGWQERINAALRKAVGL